MCLAVFARRRRARRLIGALIPGLFSTGILFANEPISTVPKLPAVEVIGGYEALNRLQGSGYILDRTELYESHVFTTNEALRKVPGINVRDEEGFGMRPNIGIRGINPTRSTKTLLLEDGLPLSYAPYGDNASYYHPPVDRFDRIEILNGTNQILFGPQTISGTINYITPAPPPNPVVTQASQAAIAITSTAISITAAGTEAQVACSTTYTRRAMELAGTPISKSTT